MILFPLHSWTNDTITCVRNVRSSIIVYENVCIKLFTWFRRLFWCTIVISYLDHWNGAMPRWRGGYWLSRVLVTSEMDSKGLPVSGLESEGQLGPFPPLMIPPRVGAEGGGAEGGTRRCCCWCCCPARCPCRLLSPLFPQLTGACCNAFPRYFDHPYFQPLAFHLTRHVYFIFDCHPYRTITMICR